MSNLLQVTPSGTIGKQTFATTVPAILKSVIITPSGANVRVVIRDGNASGTMVFHAHALSAFGSNSFELSDRGYKFLKGMHVKVLGTNGQAYLVLD